MNDNGDNIILFPNPDEVKDDDDEGDVVAIITIKEGSFQVWVSHDVETDEQKDWLLAMIAKATTCVVNDWNDVDDGSNKWEGLPDDN